MQKANKEAAREWHAEQAKLESDAKKLEADTHLLWYAANKRKSGYPSAQAFRELGMVEVAEKIEQAYALLESAYNLVP